MSSSILPFSKIDKTQLDLLEKNTADLLNLAHLGFTIPQGFVVTHFAFEEFLKDDRLQKKIEDLLSTVHYERTDSLMQVSNHIKKLINDSKITGDLIDAIATEYKKMGGVFKKGEVTVGPDKKIVKNSESLIRAIKHVWARQAEPQQLLFNHKHHKDNFKTDFSIIVQKLINNKISGQLHTADLNIETNSNLSQKQKQEIEKVGRKLKKHFYLPYIVNWTIDKGKIYIIALKPMTNTQKTYLVLVRHGESVWNARGLWTGWTDVELSQKGHDQAKEDGGKLKDIRLDLAFTSALKRAQQTLEEIKKAKGQPEIPTISNKAFNERDYGDLTGKNKWDIQKEFGDEQFMK